MPAKAGISFRQSYPCHHDGRMALHDGPQPRAMTYVGVTSNLAARVDQHRRDIGSVCCRKQGIRTLVVAEWHDTISDADRRENALKAWQRSWTFELIEQSNPACEDLLDWITLGARPQRTLG